MSLQLGRFIGVGVGPGDPELLTLKAFRYIRSAPVITFLANEEGRSQALEIAQLAIAEAAADQLQLPIPVPMSEDRTLANQAYDKAGAAIQEHLVAGRDVVFLCEGDPLFFGSFAYLLERLRDFVTEVVPGISSVNAAAAVLQHPLTMLNESFSVVSGRHSLEQLTQTLSANDSVVIMKAGRAREKVLSALETTGRMADAQYLEYIGRDEQKLVANVSQLVRAPGPYFSLFVVTRSERQT